MAYQIGQFAKSELKNFNIAINNFSLVMEEEKEMKFVNPQITLSGGEKFSSVNSYYIKFQITQLPNSEQDFSIKLKDDSALEEQSQVIRNLKVKQGNSNKEFFELIFNPNSTYSYLTFELNRIALDYKIDNPDGTSGRVMQIEILDFYIIKNIVNQLTEKYSGLKTLKKIGIQGPPGMLFVIDGEEMRIGRSGIYELNDDRISVSYIGFVINKSLAFQNGEDYFIMDFKY